MEHQRDEVHYLLQRLESFEGIVLLTTNNASSIDDAFRRRLRFRIELDTPDVDFDQLAEQFEMSGG
jgi:SpoVK/Ycf46/Vps4 family AAA+-type ATPase